MWVGIGAALFNERGNFGGLFRVNKGEDSKKTKILAIRKALMTFKASYFGVSYGGESFVLLFLGF